MKIAICEDNSVFRESLVNDILKYSKINNFFVDVVEFEDGIDLVNNFNKNEYNIIFLDIYMKNMDGIEAAKNIREIDKDCIIIFSTISLEHALDAYSVQAIDYLVKPISFEKLDSILNRCIPMLSLESKFIQVTSNRLICKIHLKDILFIEVFNKMCLIHTTNNKAIKTYMPLSEFENLVDENFLKCHRSYIINMRHIKDMLENDFVVYTNITIPIAKDKKNIIKQIYLDYIFEVTRKMDCR